MNYRRLGRSGLKVSELSLGSWVTYGNQLDVAAARECMAAAWDQGVNFFDNAEVYAAGKSEEIMGEALKKLGWPRLKVIVSTKFFWGISDGPNEKNTLNRKYLMNAIDGSLKRLQMDYVDLVYCHRPTRHADRGDGLGDARHGRARQGALLGHVGMERGGDHAAWQVAERHHLQQAGDGAARVQPLPPRRVEQEYARSTRTSASASPPGARSPRGSSPASTASAFRPTAAAPSHAWRSSWATLTDKAKNDGGGRAREGGEGPRLHARAAGDRLVRAQPARVHRHHRRLARLAGAGELRALEVLPKAHAGDDGAHRLDHRGTGGNKKGVRSLFGSKRGQINFFKGTDHHRQMHVLSKGCPDKK
jgi:hypothetical protein